METNQTINGRYFRATVKEKEQSVQILDKIRTTSGFISECNIDRYLIEVVSDDEKINGKVFVIRPEALIEALEIPAQ